MLGGTELLRNNLLRLDERTCDLRNKQSVSTFDVNLVIRIHYVLQIIRGKKLVVCRVQSTRSLAQTI